MKRKRVSEIGFHLEPFHDMVIFDLETTGLAPRFDDIIQIAAVRILDGKIMEKDFFSSYVKPQEPLSPFIVSYTGITEKDVRHAPLPSEILPRFSEFCKNSLLVAHNGQAFDLPFIFRTCERYSLNTRDSISIDSMHLSWNVWGRFNGLSHGLDSVISRLKVSTKGIRRHDARGDVLATAKCVQGMIKKLAAENSEISLNINTCRVPEIRRGK